MRARFVQYAVTLGVWWALLVDMIGNYVGQGSPECEAHIIWGVVAVIAATTTAFKFCLLRQFRRGV